MALKAADLQFRNAANGAVLTSGKLNNLFGNATTGQGASYAQLEVRNNHATLTLSVPTAWVVQDVRGGQFAIAYDSASGAIPTADPWDEIDAPTLTYTAPNTMATGIALANLTPGTKIRLVCRRIMTGATAATPENNRVWVGGTCPL